MKLEELEKSLLDMTLEEKMALLKDIREDRRISKHAITHKKKQQMDRTDKIVKKFGELSAEEQAELLKVLGE